ncbi:MAG TPA: class I SAM-dependent methyltransferase [Roseiflexaceae bacterium]|nr:class I SAM-dependent methyltransferase [Roseiflexaceae bacterium]
MDLETFNWLLTEPGQALLAEAIASDLSDAAQLRELTRLRRHATPERAAAALEIARLRLRAAAKFSAAESLYFTREALEQASGERIASYRASRYQGYPTVADLCCGAGGDTLALAGAAQVTAVDRDPLRLAMAAANARALGLAERISFLEADLERTPAPDVAAIFFDPARRSAGRRVFALSDYRPPVALARRWRERVSAIGIKIAPGVSDEEIAALDDPTLELEFISVDGELKEAVLWHGPLATAGRRATVLTDDRRPTTDTSTSLRTSEQRPTIQATTHNAQISVSAPLASPGAYLYEPDPAVIRAHAIGQLAEQIGAAQIDREIAYLTADRAIYTRFARCWRVLEWQPWNLKRLRARLRALDAGSVTVKKRGSPLDTDALARQLSGAGPRALVVVLTRVSDRPAALICEGPVRVASDEMPR